MEFSWLQEVEELSPAALTVRAQALSPNDNGKLVGDIFFPRKNVPSIKLRDVIITDDRPAADRRPWNGRGRFIPIQTPQRREITIAPVEGYDKIEEEELNLLAETADGDQARLQREMGVTLPERSDNLVMSVYRRIELDIFNAWLNGVITQRNPQTGDEISASYDFAVGRIQTALTPWGTGGTNAYDELVAWYEEGISEVGPGSGVALRISMMKRVLADAPTLQGGVKMTRSQLADRISQDLSAPFAFYTIEGTVHRFVDGGIQKQKVNVFSDPNKLAFVPADRIIGATAYAPVRRAGDLARQVPEAGIDRNGVVIYYEPGNGGRELEIDAQGNILPIPVEQNVWVIDAGDAA